MFTYPKGILLMTGPALVLLVLGTMLRAPALGWDSALQRHPVGEASGIVRLGDSLLIVDDEKPGRYFATAIPTTDVSRIGDLDTFLLNANLAVDLESIEVLTDGRVVVLSERLHALVTEDGKVVAEYDDPYGEVGKRGLEGIAVRPGEDGSSVVAAVWEGGYVDCRDIPTSIRSRSGDPVTCGGAVNAVVVIHTLPRGATEVEVEVDPTKSDTGDAQARQIELALPNRQATSEATSFRVPDLVWYRSSSGTWELIAILNSYQTLLLQRFDAATGAAIEGSTVDVTSLPGIPDGAKPNWEGLAWLEPGRSLILIDDESKQRTRSEAPFLAVVRLRPDTVPGN